MPFRPEHRGSLSRLSRASSQASQQRPKRHSSIGLASRATKRRTADIQDLSNDRPCSPAISLPGLLRRSEDEEQDDSMEHIVMAIDRTNKGTIGCAYYVAREEVLRCMEPIENGGVDAIEICE